MEIAAQQSAGTRPRTAVGTRRLKIVGLLALYVAAALTPVALAFAQELRRRPFMDELSSGLAMAGFVMLLMEFITSGRFRAVSDPVGIDLMMRFHQLIARVLTVFVLIHPFLYTLPMTARRPWDLSGAAALGLTPWSAISGFLAWGLLIAVFALALFRDGARIRYESWRLSHGAGAAFIALFGLHHTLDAGRYSAASYSAVFWIAAVCAALAALAWIHVLRPLRQLRREYRLVGVERCAHRTWTLSLEPVGSARFAFDAGQFAWVKFRKALFSVTEHPFSFSSSPAQLPSIEFMIKESGDFTRDIGRLPAGTPAFLDGAHGNFTLRRRSGKGIVFIAGGVGIAPIMSMLRQLRTERDPRPMILIYGNRIEAQIAFTSELSEISRELNLQVVYVLSEPPATWRGPTGELHPVTLLQHLPQQHRSGWLYAVCGPPAVIDSVENTLGRSGVPLAQIISERFRYEGGAPTPRERLMLAACAVVVLAIVAGIIAFALR